MSLSIEKGILTLLRVVSQIFEEYMIFGQNPKVQLEICKADKRKRAL